MDSISIVTGGTRGLGFELVKKLINDGKKVCVISRSTNQEFEEFYKKNKTSIEFFISDVSDEKKIKQIAKKICEKYDIEILINNAGTIKVGEFKDNKYEDIRNVFESNAIGTIVVTAAFLPKLKLQNSGKIVVIISSAGLLGKPMESMYCAAKFAQRGYLLALKEELKSTKIRVLGCYPGGMNSHFYEKIRDYAPKAKTDTFMNTADVAEMVCENIYAADSLNISEIIIERI